MSTPPHDYSYLEHGSPTLSEMATTASANRPTPSYGHNYRHHPYASAQSHSASRASGGKHVPSPSVRAASPRSHKSERNAAPSPLNLDVAFGQSAGAKWWDEELVSRLSPQHFMHACTHTSPLHHQA